MISLKDRLTTQKFGHNLIYLKETDSTNALAKRNIHQDEGTVFIADAQTAGRGRRGRVWVSENNGSLYMSLLVKPKISADKLSGISLAFGLAVCRALRKLSGCEAGIKWPNDIVLNSKKLCGILCEMVTENGENSVICGVGVNLNNESFSQEIADIAASLYIDADKKYDKYEVSAMILNEFEPLYQSYAEFGINAFYDEYKSCCVTLHKEVRVLADGVEEIAEAVDIAVDGGLIIRTKNGIKTVNSGEVSVRGMIGYV